MKLRNTHKTRNPFAGYPETIALRDKNKELTGYRIYAKHATPLLTKVADAVAALITVGAMIIGLDIVTQLYPDGLAEALLTAAAAAASHPAIKLGCRWLIRKTSVVEIRKHVIRINGLAGWRSYDRGLRHEFALAPHDHTKKEAEKLDLLQRKAQSKGELKLWPKYYQESAHLVLLLIGQRIDIAPVFGPKAANAIRARLSACDEVMNGQHGSGEGTVLNPEDQLGDGPGGIPLNE